MYHSVLFGNKNTWDDWRLVPSSRPYVSPPEPKVEQVDIPGSDGVLDLTNALNQFVNYKNRTGSIEFTLMNQLYAQGADAEDWEVVYSKIMNHLQGKKMNMILEDDPLYYYYGRYRVSSFKSGNHNSTITIDYDVEPYKRNVIPNVKTASISASYGQEELVWTTISFASGDIGDAPIVPEFYVNLTIPPESVDPYVYFKVPGYDGYRSMWYGQSDPIIIPEMIFRKGTTDVIEIAATYAGTVTMKYNNGGL